MTWQASWTQALTDVRHTGSEYRDVTLRMTVVMSIGGTSCRLELSNAYGDRPVVIGRAAASIDGASIPVSFNGQPGVVIQPGETVHTDSVALLAKKGDEVVVDMYLPEATAHATANIIGCPLEASAAGDHVGAAEFPIGAVPTMVAPDGTELPLSGPFLQAVDVSGANASAVVVCLGDSFTAGELAENAATKLDASQVVAVVNRGIGGNRLRTDASPEIAFYGRAGVTRFDSDVLKTAGVTHVVVELGTNDLGLPGADAPIEDLPTAKDLIATYETVAERAAAEGVEVILATISPFGGAEGYGPDREGIRAEVNEWIRNSGHRVLDFDALLRSSDDPRRLSDEVDFGDHLHPNDEGQDRLAGAIAQAFA